MTTQTPSPDESSIFVLVEGAPPASQGGSENLADELDEIRQAGRRRVETLRAEHAAELAKERVRARRSARRGYWALGATLLTTVGMALGVVVASQAPKIETLAFWDAPDVRISSEAASIDRSTPEEGVETPAAVEVAPRAPAARGPVAPKAEVEAPDEEIPSPAPAQKPGCAEADPDDPMSFCL